MGKINKRKSAQSTKNAAPCTEDTNDSTEAKRIKLDSKNGMKRSMIADSDSEQPIRIEGCHSVKADRKEELEKAKNHNDTKKSAKIGIDEIDDLFATKKEIENTKKKREEEEEKRQEQQRKMLRENKKSSSMFASKAAKNIELSQDRNDVQKIRKGEWANDGLGGVFNVDGFTGRKQDGSGYKIYKAHLFNREGFGTTKDCPFDCKCCYI
jgi:hypothetical protein